MTTYTFTSMFYIYSLFYKEFDGNMNKKIPYWIGEFITPMWLFHWIMPDVSRQKNQGISIATNSFIYEHSILK